MFYPHPTKPLIRQIRLCGLLAVAFFSGPSARAQQPLSKPQSVAPISILDSSREQDGLLGPVRRVRTETAKISAQAGTTAEGPRVLLETTTYAPQGKRLENASYPVAAGATAGKEEYEYDDKGNVIELTLRDGDGQTLSKEVFAYEFDSFGNWTKMTTSLVVFEGDHLSHEPTEITYRTISYYFDESVAKKMKPAAPADGPALTDAAGGGEHHLSKPESLKLPAKINLAADQVQIAAAAILPAGLPVRTVSGMSVKTDDPPPPPTSTAAPKQRSPMLVSGGAVNSKVINLARPLYPEEARRAGAAGVVSVRVSIDVTGRVAEASIISGPRILQAAALDAARRTRFSPAMLSGQPVASSGTINYNFTMPQ